MTKKTRFFLARATLSTLVHIGAKAAFRKRLRSVNQKSMSQNSTKGRPSGLAGDRIPEGGGGGG